MSSTDRESSKNTKRKHNSPIEKQTRTTRRRFLSSSLPELNRLNDSSGDSSGELKKMEDNLDLSIACSTASSTATATTSPTTNIGTSLTPQTPLIQSEGQTYSLPGLIYSSMCDSSFMNQLVPILANAIAPSIEKAVQSAFQNLTGTIEKQTKEINDLKKQLHEVNESKSDLQKQIRCLEESIDDLEQYGRRNSLRFHNCPTLTVNQTEPLSTDNLVINLCKSKLGIDLSEDDIFRSHTIGRPNKNGNYQIICRFKNWKLKNKVYTEKRKLRHTSIFMTEDLTRYRQGIVQELTKAKRSRSIHSFWTNDGRIFVKVHESAPKQLIR